jgi:hypothetical protein
LDGHAAFEVNGGICWRTNNSELKGLIVPSTPRIYLSGPGQGHRAFLVQRQYINSDQSSDGDFFKVRKQVNSAEFPDGYSCFSISSLRSWIIRLTIGDSPGNMPYVTGPFAISGALVRSTKQPFQLAISAMISASSMRFLEHILKVGEWDVLTFEYLSSRGYLQD